MMTGDDDLFAYARNDDPPTSHEAASAIDATKLMKIVLSVLHEAPDGLTTHEIEAITGLQAGSVTPRMKPMERRGWVERIGTRVPEGWRRQQTIWREVRA